VIGVLLAPFMPQTSAKILGALGAEAASAPLAEQLRWGRLTPGAQTRKTEALFPRIEAA
jgi:methionyl-tRNA synthetase